MCVRWVRHGQAAKAEQTAQIWGDPGTATVTGCSAGELYLCHAMTLCTSSVWTPELPKVAVMQWVFTTIHLNTYTRKESTAKQTNKTKIQFSLEEHCCFLISHAEENWVAKVWPPPGSDWINQVQISSNRIILLAINNNQHYNQNKETKEKFLYKLVVKKSKPQLLWVIRVSRSKLPPSESLPVLFLKMDKKLIPSRVKTRGLKLHREASLQFSRRPMQNPSTTARAYCVTTCIRRVDQQPILQLFSTQDPKQTQKLEKAPEFIFANHNSLFK